MSSGPEPASILPCRDAAEAGGPVGELAPLCEEADRKSSVAQTRLALLKSNFSLSLVNRVVSSARAWLVNPFLIICLGPENYGVWTALASINTLDLMLDLGLGNSLVNAVATARGQGREDRVAALISFVLRKLMALSVAAASILLVLSWCLDVSHVFPFIRPDNREAHWSLFFILASLILSTPLSVVEKVEAGYQKFHFVWSAQILANLFSLACFAACWIGNWRPGMAAISLISLGPALLSKVINWAFYFGVMAPDLRPCLQVRSGGMEGDWDKVNRTGWQYFYLQCAYLVCFSLDYLLVGNAAGGKIVGVFACISAYSAAAGLLASLLIQPLWPAYNEATAAKDYEWCRVAFRRSTVLGLLSTVAGCLALHLLEPVLLKRFAPGIPLTGAMMLAGYCAVVLETLKFSLNTLLNGLDRLRFLLITHGAFFLVATPLKLYVLTRGDLVDFLWLRTFLSLLILVLPAAWLAHRSLFSRTGPRR